MRKYISFLTIPLLFACNDGDNIYLNGITVKEVFSDYSDTRNENGKYVNYFGAHVQNSSPKAINGYVRFKVKDYGNIDSYIYIVKPNNESQTYFEASLETDKVINDSYLLGTEFVNVKN